MAPVSLRGRNWNTSEDGFNRLEEDVIRQPQFSHVVILFGNNDCWMEAPNKPKVSIENLKLNLAKMVKSIKNNMQTPILCNLQPIDSDRFFKTRPDFLEYKTVHGYDPVNSQKQYNRAIESFAHEEGIDWIDIRKKLEVQGDNVIANDGLHPNDSGHKIIANTILDHLKQIDASIIQSQIE